MTAARMAQVLPFLKTLLPRTGVEAVMSVAPDVAFAGLSAMAAPEGTSFGERLGIGAVDLVGFGLVPSVLGRGAGRLAGSKLFKLKNEGVEVATNLGEMGFQMAPAFMGMQNPLLTRAFEKQAQNEQQLLLMQEEDKRRREEEVLAGTIAYGAGVGLAPMLGRAAPQAADGFVTYAGLG